MATLWAVERGLPIGLHRTATLTGNGRVQLPENSLCRMHTEHGIQDRCHEGHVVCVLDICGRVTWMRRNFGHKCEGGEGDGV